jgi:hypothetical protein
MCTSFLPETRRIARKLHRQILGCQPLLREHGRNRLLAGRNQKLVLRIFILDDFVEFLVKLLELRGLGHVLSLHEIRRLEGIVALRDEEV